MASAARSIALGLALGGMSPNTGTYTYAAGPRLRTPSSRESIKTVDERASKACGLRITLASQPAGIWRDCGGAGCEALSHASRFKNATVGIFGGPTHHIGDASSWREIFDVDCVDGGRILHVTFDPVEGHSLVCELGPAENISSVRDKVCSGPDGARFYYTVEHVETLPPKYTGVDRVDPLLAPRLLQSGSNSTTSSPTTSTSDISETDAPAVQATSSPTPESTPSPETLTPAPTVVVTLEATTVEPTAEPTTAESTAEPITVEPTAEPTTVEPTAGPTTVEPTAESTADTTTVEPTAEPTADPTTAEPTAEPITVEPTAGPTPTPEPTSVPETKAPTPKQTSVPETKAPTPKPTTTPVAATPQPTAELAPEPTSSPVGRTPAPSVENTPTPTLLPSPKPSTPEPSRIIVPTSQPTLATSQPTTLEPTPTPSGMTSVGEPTAMPVVSPPPTPQLTAIVAPVPSPTATSVTPVTAPTTSLPPSLRPTTSPSGASTSVMTNSPVESATQPPVSSPTMSPTRAVRPTTPPVAALPTSAPVDSMTTEPTGRTESIAPVGATPAMELTAGPASVPAPNGTGTLMPAAASTVAPSSELFVTEENSYSSPITLVTLTASPSTASPEKEVVSTPVPLPTPPPPPPSPSPAASSAAPTGNGSAAASAASTGDASEGTTSAPMSAPTVTPSTEAPVDPPQPEPTVQATALPTTEGPVAVTPTSASPVAGPGTPGPTPAPTLTTPAPSVDECMEVCLDIDTGNTWTGNYFDSTCSTNSSQGGCGLNTGQENCRRCVINRVNYEDGSSASAEADEWPPCPCCVALDADVLEESDEDCVAPTPSPASQLETIILSEDDPEIMMLTGAFDNVSCEVTGIAITDNTVMLITSFSDSNGDCTESFDKLYGTTECDSDTTYSWTYTSTEYTYTYECPDPDTSNSARFRRRRLSEGDDAVAISSENVLCNNDDMFYSVSRVAEDESVAIVYANNKAEGFENVTNDIVAFASGGVAYCEGASGSTTAALNAGVDTLIAEPDGNGDSGIGTTAIAIIASVVAVVVLLSLCVCYCCYRSRKGKEGRADQMRRNLGFTPDMDRKGEGNFGPTNKHVAITRGGGAQMTSEMLATKSFQPGTGQHHRAPSEAPSSIIEDNIANNYRPKKAAQNWEKRKEHKLTKPAPQQHVIGAGPTSEELKVEDNMPATSVRSEQLSEHSLTQHDISSARQSGSHPSVAQTQYSYAFNDVEMDPAEEEEDDDDARSAATGMSGPSKYAPSGYAPSSHHEGVTHDLMSQYEPSVYEADSQYDPSLYGRESEFGEESSAYSYGPSSRNGAYGQGGNYAARGRQAVPHGQSARASVADTAAMSHLGSVMEMDDGGETSSAYAPSDSYVSSYVSSEDDEIGRGRPIRGHHHLAESRTPPGGYGSRHNVYRSGREAVNAGRGGFGGGGGSSIEASSRHSGGRSGFEVDSRDFDEEDSDMHHIPAAMDDMEYQDSRITTSSQGAPLTGVDDRNGRRW